MKNEMAKRMTLKEAEDTIKELYPQLKEISDKLEDENHEAEIDRLEKIHDELQDKLDIPWLCLELNGIDANEYIRNLLK